MTGERRSQRGYMTVIAILVLMVIFFTSSAYIRMKASDHGRLNSAFLGSQALYLAEAAAIHAFSDHNWRKDNEDGRLWPAPALTGTIEIDSLIDIDGKYTAKGVWYNLESPYDLEPPTPTPTPTQGYTFVYRSMQSRVKGHFPYGPAREDRELEITIASHQVNLAYYDSFYDETEYNPYPYEMDKNPHTPPLALPSPILPFHDVRHRPNEAFDATDSNEDGSDSYWEAAGNFRLWWFGGGSIDFLGQDQRANSNAPYIEYCGLSFAIPRGSSNPWSYPYLFVRFVLGNFDKSTSGQIRSFLIWINSDRNDATPDVPSDFSFAGHRFPYDDPVVHEPVNFRGADIALEATFPGYGRSGPVRITRKLFRNGSYEGTNPQTFRLDGSIASQNNIVEVGIPCLYLVGDVNDPAHMPHWHEPPGAAGGHWGSFCCALLGRDGRTILDYNKDFTSVSSSVDHPLDDNPPENPNDPSNGLQGTRGRHYTDSIAEDDTGGPYADIVRLVTADDGVNMLMELEMADGFLNSGGYDVFVDLDVDYDLTTGYNESVHNPVDVLPPGRASPSNAPWMKGVDGFLWLVMHNGQVDEEASWVYIWKEGTTASETKFIGRWDFATDATPVSIARVIGEKNERLLVRFTPDTFYADDGTGDGPRPSECRRMAYSVAVAHTSQLLPDFVPERTDNRSEYYTYTTRRPVLPGPGAGSSARDSWVGVTFGEEKVVGRVRLDVNPTGAQIEEYGHDFFRLSVPATASARDHWVEYWYLQDGISCWMPVQNAEEVRYRSGDDTHDWREIAFDPVKTPALRLVFRVQGGVSPPLRLWEWGVYSPFKQTNLSTFQKYLAAGS